MRQTFVGRSVRHGSNFVVETIASLVQLLLMLGAAASIAGLAIGLFDRFGSEGDAVWPALETFASGFPGGLIALSLVALIVAMALMRIVEAVSTRLYLPAR